MFAGNIKYRKEKTIAMKLQGFRSTSPVVSSSLASSGAKSLRSERLPRFHPRAHAHGLSRGGIRMHSKYTGIFVLIFIIVLIMFFVFKKNNYNLVKRILVINKSGSSVQIAIIDNIDKDLTLIEIPKNTQVEAAKGLGIWKIGSIWELGENENISGDLLVATVIKSFLIPVDNWVSNDSFLIKEKNVPGLIGLIFKRNDSNINLLERIRIVRFLLSIKNKDIMKYNLQDTSVIRESNLKDDTPGFIITGSKPQNIYSLFADRVFLEKSFRVIIRQPYGGSNLTKELVEILETIGSKPTIMGSDGKSEEGCIIYGNDRYAVNRVSSLFKLCRYVNKKSSADVEISFGESTDIF